MFFEFDFKWILNEVILMLELYLKFINNELSNLQLLQK
jgi:hypothetical protein